jgi:hypothetical protein
MSRPCVWGVFGRRVGGLLRNELSVGCLRCTTQYPDVAQIHPNEVGDSYLRPEHIDTITTEQDIAISPDGPWFFLVAQSAAGSGACRLIGITFLDEASDLCGHVIGGSNPCLTAS